MKRGLTPLSFFYEYQSVSILKMMCFYFRENKVLGKLFWKYH